MNQEVVPVLGSSRVCVGVLTVCGAAVLLSSCATEAEEPVTASVAGSTADTAGTVPTDAGTATESSATAQSDPWSNRIDPQKFVAEDGGHLFRLTGGEVCSIGGGLTASEFACLLNFREPMPTEDGTLTRGIEFRDGMFTPSEALADPAVEKTFEQSKSRAELLEPGQSLETGGFTIIVETDDEVMFLRGGGEAQFFIAEQGHTPFWTPRPGWIPLPDHLEDVEGW